MHFPDYRELLQGCAGFIANEKRDAMYKIALKHIAEANWNPEKLAEGIGVLLLTWNAKISGVYSFSVIGI